jgi:hypothetical protein
MHSIYTFFQEEVIESVKQQQADGKLVDFAGDGKFDSPGQYNIVLSKSTRESLPSRVTVAQRCWVSMRD